MIIQLNATDANKIFRKSIINEFFINELTSLDFKKSGIRHPSISEDGLMQSHLLHIFFDIETGSDYPDGDEWFITEFLFPYDMKLPANTNEVVYVFDQDSARWKIHSVVSNKQKFVNSGDGWKVII